MPWFDDVSERLAAASILRIDDDTLLRAAVLVPMFVQAHELWVLLTTRAGSLALHGGEIAFPGGAVDPGDEDETATALREAHEELGIDEVAVMILGQLSDVVTASGYLVAPVVGAVPFPLSLEPAPGEVEAVLSIPLSALANPRLVELQSIEVGGEAIESPVYHLPGATIRGATARIVADLVERITSPQR